VKKIVKNFVCDRGLTPQLVQAGTYKVKVLSHKASAQSACLPQTHARY